MFSSDDSNRLEGNLLPVRSRCNREIKKREKQRVVKSRNDRCNNAVLDMGEEGGRGVIINVRCCAKRSRGSEAQKENEISCARALRTSIIAHARKMVNGVLRNGLCAQSRKKEKRNGANEIQRDEIRE